MAPLAPSPRSLPPWRAAQEQVRHAEKLLHESPPPLLEVARHLERGWIYLYRELYGEDQPQGDPEQQTRQVERMAGLLHEPVLSGERDARALVFSEDRQGEAARALAEAPAVHEGLQAEVEALERAIDEIAARSDGSAALGVGLLVAVLLLLVFAPLIGDIGGTVTAPWRGRYYDNDKFEGEPRERFDRLLDFDFGRDSPMRGIGKDRFSIRWDTCLVLEEDTTIRFQLASDDGSRLYIDGDEVVDNWGDHATEKKSARVALDAGAHYLEVEYYDAKYGGDIKLEAAVGKEKLQGLPVDMLQAPGDGDDPCG